MAARCPQCSYFSSRCDKGDKDCDWFMVELVGEFDNSVKIPCFMRNKVDEARNMGDTLDVGTAEGFSYSFVVDDRRRYITLGGHGWRDFVDQFDMKEGESVLFKHGPYFDIVPLDCNGKGKNPIVSPIYQILKDNERLLYHSMQCTKREIVNLDQIDEAVDEFLKYVPFIGNPLIHQLSTTDIQKKDLKVSEKIGTSALPGNGTMLLCRQPRCFIRAEFRKISAKDQRIRITKGWDKFVEKNQDLHNGDIILMVLKMVNRKIRLYVKKLS